MKSKVKSYLTGGKLQQLFEDGGKLMLRLLFGLSLAINHGWPTLSNGLAGNFDFPDPIGLGPGLSIALVGFAELICAFFVATGLFTRIFVIPVVINFSVAFFIFHLEDPFGRKELAYLYLSAMSAIVFLGPGKFSLDYLIFKDN